MSTTKQYLLPVRLAVAKFALAMEAKLRENDHKTGWKSCSVSWLLERASSELKELRGALIDRKTDGFSKGVQYEAADVANFVMMVADVTGQLNEVDLEYGCVTITDTEAGTGLALLTNAMRKDPELAWSWHCNLAVMAQDAGAPHREANIRAASLMYNIFGVKVSETVRFNEILKE